MEDFGIDVMIGRGPSARSLRLGLKPFTVVGATTRAGRISSPLRDRFGAVYRLDYYAVGELATIIERSAGILGVEIDAGRGAASLPDGEGERRASSTGCCAACVTSRRSVPTDASARPRRKPR